MDVKSVARLSQEIEALGVSPRAFGAALQYLAEQSTETPASKVSASLVASELDEEEALIRTILARLADLGALTSVSNVGQYVVKYDELEVIVDRIQWLSLPENRQSTESLLRSKPTRIEVVTSSPAGVGGIPPSNITGRMVEMVASASDSVMVVNPFFTRDGLGLLLEAFVAATERGLSLKMITRDVLFGDQSNASDMNRLLAEIGDGGDVSKFEMYEINTEAFPEASLHAKAIVADEDAAYVGSANLTEQSLQNAVEMGLYLEGPPVDEIAEYLEKCCKSDLFCAVDSGKL
jgi:phosphatidylserine/phosphatidylglycerophosphate/cardiolipin synthase-like enzyme